MDIFVNYINEDVQSLAVMERKMTTISSNRNHLDCSHDARSFCDVETKSNTAIENRN